MSRPIRSTRDVEALLARAERSIALVDRCRPRDYAASLAALVGRWRLGEHVAPAWSYAPLPDLAALRAALESVELDGPIGELYAARAAELALEAAAAAWIGSPAFGEHAARRFAAPADEDGARALSLANAWCGEPLTVEQPRALSDDARDPRSLLCCLQRTVGELRLPFRVVVSADLASAAATGDGVILVRAGASHGERAVARTVLHEVEGHALPRHRAAAESLGLFRVGAAGAADDEEGRALLIERRAGFLDAGRRAELGRRHLAALSVRDGAGLVDTVELLLARDTPLDAALGIAARVHRGGGLAREIVYLPALVRVERALEGDPALEHWLERGRLGVEAARVLSVQATEP